MTDEDAMMKSVGNADALIDDEADAEKSIPFEAYEVSFYGADYPVDGIVQRLKKNDIVIPRVGEEFGNKNPGFQRPFVWSNAQSDKFIESLLMGLPVPGIFLTKTKDNEFLVLDGQQRLLTLMNFCAENRKLGSSVQKKYQKKTYKDLTATERRRLDNSIIHATIIRQESPRGNDSVYYIFERLNSGGRQLTPQQIRMALYHGEFANLLTKLNQNNIWRKLIRQNTTDLAFKGFKDIEMILRFFALFYNSDEYKNPMQGFLNKFMEEHRNIKVSEQKQFERLFCKTVEFISQFIGESAFCGRGKRPSAAIVDSLMFGVAKGLKRGIPDLSPKEVKSVVNAMLDNEEYQSAIGKRTSMAKHVEQRLNLSEQAFCPR